MESMKSLRYGFGFSGQYRTLKVRLNYENAGVFINELAVNYRQSVKRYVTKERKVFLSIVEHQRANDFWYCVERALEKAKKHVEPKQLTLGL